MILYYLRTRSLRRIEIVQKRVFNILISLFEKLIWRNFVVSFLHLLFYIQQIDVYRKNDHFDSAGVSKWFFWYSWSSPACALVHFVPENILSLLNMEHVVDCE